MDRCVGAAARLPESDRKDLAIQALAQSATISPIGNVDAHLATSKLALLDVERLEATDTLSDPMPQ